MVLLKKISLIFYEFPALWPILVVSSNEYTALPGPPQALHLKIINK